MNVFLVTMLLVGFVHSCKCKRKDLGYFPVLLADNVHYRYYSVERNQKLLSKGTNVKRVRVYDDMECIGRCSRMGDSCKSVNYKKKDADGLHLCELIIKDTYDQPEALSQKIHDKTYQHISLERPIYKTCAEVYKNNGRRNAVYNIAPIPSLSLYVYCDMTTAGGGWTVIQKRIDGSVDFFRNWAQYKKGFGNKLGEYWLGLDNMHAMTSRGGYKLRIDMEDFDGEKRYAEYEYFRVGDESVNYRLEVKNFSGDANDSLSYHDNKFFSTPDRDNDHVNRTCTAQCLGAWWYDGCYQCNPNGPYVQEGTIISPCRGVIWNTWHGSSYSLKRFEMKIKSN